MSKQSATFFGEIKSYLKEKLYQCESKLIEFMLENSALKSLYKASRDEEKRIRDLLRSCTEKVKINLIDVGMVIKL